MQKLIIERRKRKRTPTADENVVDHDGIEEKEGDEEGPEHDEEVEKDEEPNDEIAKDSGSEKCAGEETERQTEEGDYEEEL